MGEWKKTGCVLCAQNCGLEVMVENNRIVKVRGDRSNGKSQGYLCRKGMNIANFQHNADRLKYPLKRVGSGFARISWEQAIDEIAEKLKTVVDSHGPRSFAFMGGGGQGSHFEAAFALRLLRGLGSQYHYSALAQEFSGYFWVNGRTFGRQSFHDVPDVAETELLLVIGWNGMQSHQIPQAPKELQRLARDPDKLLIVVDPRKSETAKIADLHLPIRPGTDALLLRVMIAIILRNGWENREYLAAHTSAFDRVRSLFLDFDAEAAVKVCELDFGRVTEVSRLFATRKSSLRYDLGIFMNRHSAVSSYLATILLAICGRIGTRGGNVFPGHLMPLGGHSDESNPKTWHAVASGLAPVLGTFSPNIMPEEIMTDHPDRLRAVIVSGSNPLRSYADTQAYEEAFKRLDLLVTVEVAMTETAAMSDYVLPIRSGYESHDGTFFAVTYPEVYFQMRQPVVEPEGEPLESGEIYLRLADRLGIVPPIPESLHQAAAAGTAPFGKALMQYAMTEPAALKNIPFVLGKTLGKAMGSVHKSLLWGLLQNTPKSFRENAARAGFPADFTLAETIFRTLTDHPEGIAIGRLDPDRNMEELRTEDGRINMHIPELIDELAAIDAAREELALAPDPAFPLVLMAGRHTSMNANTLMRNPEWNKGMRPCTLAMHPADAEALHLLDGQRVRITTEAGSEEIELEITDTARQGHVAIPHGFGLVYDRKAHGVNVNRLTRNTHRDRFGTPMHRYVPCRVEAL